MPAFTFTANSGDDKLSIAAHGQVTGNGPVVVWNWDGALPAPLVALTDYWIIRIDDGSVKLATSQANALAGTAIDLTTNGTGTNKLGIRIPYRRSTTYTALSQIKSLDLTEIQDEVVRLYKERRIQLSWADFTSQRTGTKGKLHATNFDRWIKDIDSTFACECGIYGIPAGATINVIENYFKRGNVAGSSANVELVRMAKDGAPGSQVQVGIASDTGIDGIYRTLTLTLNHLVLGNQVYWIQTGESSQAASNGYEMLGASIFWTPPVL